MLSALYLDQVAATSDSYGVSQYPLFCLGFGKELHVDAVDHAHDAAGHDDDALEHLAHLSNDVKDEYQRVHVMVAKSSSLSQSSIVTMRLRKVYPGGKEAVKGLSLAIERGECFGMLGRNGAGKTTSINMLVGFSRPTSGTATVERLSISRTCRASIPSWASALSTTSYGKASARTNTFLSTAHSRIYQAQSSLTPSTRRQ